VSKLERCLWGADFMISGIGWYFGGGYGALLCFVIGALLIMSGFFAKDESNRVSPILIDERTPYVKPSWIKMWHKIGLVASVTVVIGLIAHGVVVRAQRNPPTSLAAIVKHPPCSTPFRPGLFSYGNITENGQIGLDARGKTLPKVTSSNDTSRSGGAMVEAEKVGKADLQHNTAKDGGKILKAGAIDTLKMSDNHAEGNSPPPTTDKHPFNVGDWFDFLGDYENSVVNKNAAKEESAITHLRDKLEADWQPLPKGDREDNEKELETALAAIKGQGFNPHYRDWPPTFVERPCDDK
jgi:hypothetical protein